MKHIHPHSIAARNALFLTAMLLATAVNALATETDLTHLLAGAACDNAAYWTISHPSSAGESLLQCDTWSGRGGKDGSNMTTPFMEYWQNKSVVGGLPDATIRHTIVNGLPQGHYRLSLRVRCYCEASTGTPSFGGVRLYANGTTTADLAAANATNWQGYGEGAYIAGTWEVAFEVDTNGTLEWGLDIANAPESMNWVAWKDVQLTYLDGQDGPTQEVTDVTSLIRNADFENANGWNGSPTIGGTWGQRNAEKYNTTFDVYQTLTGLSNGWYRLSAQGFYRYGDYHDEQHKYYTYREESDNNNIYAVYTIPYAVVSRQQGTDRRLAVLYANNVEKGLPSPLDYAHATPTHTDDYPTPFGWATDTQTGASEAFADGEYPIDLLVPVTNGQLRLGVKKSLGYKYDWACWDHFQLHYLGTANLVYADGIELDATSLNLTVGEQRQISATATPSNASDPTLTWASTNTEVVSVDSDGQLTANGPGTATIRITATGSNGGVLTRSVSVSVGSGASSPDGLLINEIQVSNIDMFIDPSYNYGSYIELYNPTSNGISLDGLYVSDDPSLPTKCRLTARSGAVPPHGFALVWFDHHDANDGQADMELDMDGGTICISDNNGQLIDSKTYPRGIGRTSFARTTDGGSFWAVTAYPTPGGSNAGSREWVDATLSTQLPLPTVSHASQLFDSPFTMHVVIPEGATLHYTTDGSTPTDTHGMVSIDGNFDIAATTILRLRLYQNGALPSGVRTCSYIFRDKDYMLPVVSVVSDDTHFYGDTLGVFVTGTNGIDGSGIAFPCNWNQEWDRPVGLNFITADNEEACSQEVTLKRFGGWSRSWFPYNFKLKAEKRYEGINYIAHQPFAQKSHLKHKVWQLRNGGNDLYCRIKDVAIQQIIMTSGFYIDCQDYLPVHSFINGHYQGMLNLREPSNKHFAYANYGIDTDAMDQLELHGGWTVNEGSADAFAQWRDLSYSASDETVYAKICEQVDIDEFANYMAAQIFLGGDDWPTNNCKAFKGNDGKWHIVFFDVDQTLRFDTYAFSHITSNQNCPLVTIFFNMLGNERFRKQFVDAFCLVAGSVFAPERCSAIIDRLSDEMNPALALEGLSTDPTASYVKAALSATRRDAMMSALASWSHAGITGNSLRTRLACNIEEASLLLNGQQVPTGRFDGTLFTPAIVKADAPAGFSFKGWTNSKGQIVATNAEIDLSQMEELSLTATFIPLASDQMKETIATPLKVNEVSASNTVYVNDWYAKGDWLELYNNTDTDLNAAGLYISDDVEQLLKYQIRNDNGVANTIVPARGHLVVWADELESTGQLHANFRLSNDDGQTVTVASSDDFVANNSDYFAEHPEMRAFIDGLTYIAHRGDQSVGRFPDGGSDFYLMSRPTIEARNSKLTTDSLIGHDQNLKEGQGVAIDLAKGWNWVSHPLALPIGTTQLSAQAQRIVAQRSEAYRDTKYGMTGTLKRLEAGQLYKVEMNADDTFESETPTCKSDLPIGLLPGWNWVGYPVKGEQTVANALSGFLAAEGDALVGQDGFAVYSNGQWTGSLTTLSTGKGYMMRVGKAQTLRFKAPAVALGVKGKMRPRLQPTQRHGIDKHAYPQVMGLVAQLHTEGAPILTDQLLLLAYADDECRGAANIDSLTFLTLYGDGGERIRYRALDTADGTLYAIVESDTFTPGVTGLPTQPRQLTLGERLDTVTTIGDITVATPSSDVRPTAYYSLGGTLVGHSSISLRPGIYIVGYNDGHHGKVIIRQ